MAKQTRAPARRKPAAQPKPKRKGGPLPGTPSPMRLRMTPELQAHVKRLYEHSEQPVTQIAADCDVDESVIRRMGEREGWVRYVAPPRDLPPVAKLLAEVEALEAARAVVLRGAQERAPQDDGENAEPDAAPNVERFTQVVMAHLDEFEAVRRNGKLLAKHHLTTARAISLLTEAFNRLQRLRAAQPGSIHDDLDDMPADLDAFREDLALRIAAFMESRTDESAFGEPAAAPAGDAR